jgi:VWFA-related protein
MSLSRRLLVSCAALAIACAALVLRAQTQTPTSPQATFRTGIDIIQLDVSVLDRNNQPVRGLTAADFTVVEGGKPQPVVAFVPIDVPDPVAPPAAWMRDVSPDVVSNTADARRLVVIVMDDANSRFEPDVMDFAQRIARQTIAGLGPHDLAAVVHTFQGRAQNFTTDRALLLAAAASFKPKKNPIQGVPLACQIKSDAVGGCAVETLKIVGDALRDAPPGRKMLVFISSGLPFDERVLENLGPVQDMFRALQRANVAVYGFSPDGLLTLSATAADASSAAASTRIEGMRASEGGLRTFAENTGGRAFVSTNEPWLGVTDVFRENSFYYLLGFRSSDPVTDGRFRKVEVRVNRPGVTVRSRTGYFGPRKEKPSTRKATALDAAISRGLPTGDLPLTVSTAAFAVAGKRELQVAVVVGVRDSIAEGRARSAAAPNERFVEVIATAFDQTGKSYGAHRQTMSMTIAPAAGPDLHFEVVSRLPLRPGRYEVRFAATSGGRTGSVFAPVEVPDVAKAPVSLSGLVLERAPGPKVAPADGLKDLIPAIPTSVRTFARSDRVASFLRVYQPEKGSLYSARVTSRDVNERNEPIVDHAVVIEAPRFTATRSADHRIELPIARLAPGEYLLSIEAVVGKSSAERHARFTVK